MVDFYGISTIIGYFMPNPLDTYKLNIYDLVWLTFMAYQPLSLIQCQILFIRIFFMFIICEHVLLITFLNDPECVSDTENSIYNESFVTHS